MDAVVGRAAGGARGGRLGLARIGGAALRTANSALAEEQWCIPPEANADFICHMEDVLKVYTRPYDLRRPQACLDETSGQLLAKTLLSELWSLPVGPLGKTRSM